MDYKELLEDRDFKSPEEICEWMDKAATAITDLLARAEAEEARAEKAEEAIAAVKKARDRTRPASVVDDILRKFYSQREGQP